MQSQADWVSAASAFRRVRILRRGSRSTCVHRRDVNLILILRPASVRVECAHDQRRARANKHKHMHVAYTHAYTCIHYLARARHRQSRIGRDVITAKK